MPIGEKNKRPFSKQPHRSVLRSIAMSLGGVRAFAGACQLFGKVRFPAKPPPTPYPSRSSHPVPDRPTLAEYWMGSRLSAQHCEPVPGGLVFLQPTGGSEFPEIKKGRKHLLRPTVFAIRGKMCSRHLCDRRKQEINGIGWNSGCGHILGAVGTDRGAPRKGGEVDRESKGCH